MAQEKGRDSKDGKESTPRKGEENYEFIPPDFDEDAFIHKELVSFRTTLILFLWAIVAAAVSWGAFAAMGGSKTAWLVGIAIAAVFFLGLRRLFAMLKVDVKHFGKREWLGTAALFSFTWLAFFIIAINPPISDFAPPRVELHASPMLQEADDEVTIDLFVEDNHGVDEHSFTLRHDGQAIATEDQLVSMGRGHYRYVATGLAPGTYEAVAAASDDTGHSGNDSIQFAVIEKALLVTLPEGSRLDQATDQVLVKAAVPGFDPCQVKKGRVTNAPCVRTVQLRFADGRTMDLEHSSTFGGWQATSNFAGWHGGDNNFTVVAQMLPTYAGQTKVDGGNITAGPFEVTVDTANNPLGDYAPKVIAEPKARQRNVPGLELPLLTVGLLGAALLLARRRHA
ncbi:MAG TPA: hypothetical protein VM327_05390 [Candidatus Thermoplasmatota archaeon]|nr:hypothetical protein [Candidatus Thermoplasmatota archaeon]